MWRTGLLLGGAAAARAGGASAVRSALLAPWEPKAAERIARKPTAGSEKLLKKLAAAQADHVEQEEQGGAYAVHCAVRGKADDCVELLLDALRDPAIVFEPYVSVLNRQRCENL